MILRIEPITMAVIAFIVFVVFMAGGIYVDQEVNHPPQEQSQSK